MHTADRRLSAFVVPIVAATLIANLAACGTIMYPERSGQRAGQIDPLVAVLDGVGLLFFLIPGVIAFAVDFNNHSIYLPHGHSSRHGAAHDYSQHRVARRLDKAGIEGLIREETGLTVDLNQPDFEIVRLDSAAELDSRFAAFDRDARVASALPPDRR